VSQRNAALGVRTTLPESLRGHGCCVNEVVLVDYEGMRLEILELFVEAQQRAIRTRQTWRTAIVDDPRVETRFATQARALRRSLDDRFNRRRRKLRQASIEAQAAVADVALRAAYASTFTEAQARLRGQKGF
jgi:hypothetical protein